MSIELLYTSAPKGIRPGSRGFCTVLATSEVSRTIVQSLESLCGYRHVFQPHETKGRQNPTTYAHYRMVFRRTEQSVLSRVSDYGADYSGRTNKLAHHVVLDASEESPSGPSDVLFNSGIMRTSWDTVCARPASGPTIPSRQLSAGPCLTWKNVTGDPAWAGVLVNTWLQPKSKLCWVILDLSQMSQACDLLHEAVLLLPAAQRWQATFSSYCSTVPPNVTCKVRFVLAGSDEARLASARGQVIDLTRTLGTAPESEAATYARIGQAIPLKKQPEPKAKQDSIRTLPVEESETEATPAVSKAPAPDTTHEDDLIELQLASLEPMQASPPPMPHLVPSPSPIVYEELPGKPAPSFAPPSSTPWIVATAVAVGLVLVLASVMLAMLRRDSSDRQAADGRTTSPVHEQIEQELREPEMPPKPPKQPFPFAIGKPIHGEHFERYLHRLEQKKWEFKAGDYDLEKAAGGSSGLVLHTSEWTIRDSGETANTPKLNGSGRYRVTLPLFSGSNKRDVMLELISEAPRRAKLETLSETEPWEPVRRIRLRDFVVEIQQGETVHEGNFFQESIEGYEYGQFAGLQLNAIQSEHGRVDRISKSFSAQESLDLPGIGTLSASSDGTFQIHVKQGRPPDGKVQRVQVQFEFWSKSLQSKSWSDVDIRYLGPKFQLGQASVGLDALMSRGFSAINVKTMHSVADDDFQENYVFQLANIRRQPRLEIEFAVPDQSSERMTFLFEESKLDSADVRSVSFELRTTTRDLSVERESFFFRYSDESRAARDWFAEFASALQPFVLEKKPPAYKALRTALKDKGTRRFHSNWFTALHRVTTAKNPSEELFLLLMDSVVLAEKIEQLRKIQREIDSIDKQEPISQLRRRKRRCEEAIEQLLTRDWIRSSRNPTLTVDQMVSDYVHFQNPPFIQKFYQQLVDDDPQPSLTALCQLISPGKEATWQANSYNFSGWREPLRRVCEQIIQFRKARCTFVGKHELEIDYGEDGRSNRTLKLDFELTVHVEEKLLKRAQEFLEKTTPDGAW